MTTQTRQPAGTPAGGQYTVSPRTEQVTGLTPVPTLAGVPVPVVSFNEPLWHVGSMNPADKNDQSYEGAGLSVSVHPDDWEYIARLGDSPRWALERPRNGFLNYHDLTGPQRAAITSWGVTRGYIEPVIGHLVSWQDLETDRDTTMLCTTRDEADEEAEEREGTVEQVDTFATTGTFPDPTVRAGSLNEHDILTTIWAQECTDLDGVWWEDRYDPEDLSCPRGVILPDRLDRWNLEGGRPGLEDQHPRNGDGTWQAHCTSCGTYVDDHASRPSADFLCDEC